MGRKNKKGNSWIVNEHIAFLKGLNFHEKGNWANKLQQQRSFIFMEEAFISHNQNKCNLFSLTGYK